MYLLSVLPADKTTEITTVVNFSSSYAALDAHLPSSVVAIITPTALHHHTKRFHAPTYASLISSITSDPPAASAKRTAADEEETLRNQYSRFLPPAPTVAPSRAQYLSLVMEVLGKYYNADVERSKRIAGDQVKDWVYLLTPFVCCLSRPVAMFLGFQRLVDRIGECVLVPCQH